MITKSKHLIIGVFLSVLSICNICAQEQDYEKNKKRHSKLAFFDLRGTNAIDVAIGTTFIDGDLPDPEFEIYFRIGYKRQITNHLSLNLTYNKYNLAFKDIYNEGYMSFDANFEFLFSPYKVFSPFIHAGYGYNASNYFESTSTKVQGALGFECIIMDGVGLKLFGEYNYAFSDELDGLIEGETDDAFIRVGFGVNLYFGGNKRKQKLLSQIDTVIQSNLVK
jgi:curli production assembly/transport component CsgG